VGVDGQPVRPDERGQRPSGKRVADPRQQFALIVDDADPRPEIGVEAINRKFADIADWMANIIHVKPARPVEVVPLGLVLAIAVEYLDPVVLTVGHIDPAMASVQMLWTRLNWPGSLPGSPHDSNNLPSGAYL
jgi:hypothetical protein